jgi:glycogen debranching enzyme
MKHLSTLALLHTIFFIGCSDDKKPDLNLFNEMSKLDSIEGKSQYLASPFVTAGDRVYVVGFQNGTFPDLGWHIDGEMGGVWNHPIKLLDGYSASLSAGSASYCLDRFDKFVNYPIGNKHRFTLSELNLEIERSQFIPDTTQGLIVEYRIVNRSNSNQSFRFSFTGMTDLRPTWLAERTNMTDAADDLIYDNDLSAIIGKDKNNPWYVAYGSTLDGEKFLDDSVRCGPDGRKGQGKNGTLSYSINIDAGKEVVIPIFIAGSYTSEADLKSTYISLKTNSLQYFNQKKERFAKIASTANLIIPDKKVSEMYTWLKYNTDWLVRNVPEEGSALSAGLPDYPWWFGCDNTYALQGVLATGNHQLVKNTIVLLNKISKRTNTNGRIVHEVSTNGSVYNPGNVNETAQFITLLWNYYAWTGDKALIAELYPDIQKGISWLQKEKDPDGNGYPNGSGMMEIPGLDTEMIDVVAYTQQAYASAAKLAIALNDDTSSAQYQNMADDLKLRINNEWWQSNDKSFGDFRGTIEEAKPVIAAALVRADTLGKPWAVAELKATQNQLKKYPASKQMPHVVYHNWVVNTPLETGVADPAKAKVALQSVKKYQNPFGVFVTGIDRTEEADSVVLKSRKKIFSYTGAVMTLPTGVQAVAEARYGNPEEALKYIKKLQNSFSFALPGSMYEVSPDFGMVTQAWNIYGVAVPVVNYFFGITPRAYEKSILLNPKMPSEWREASLKNIIVGENQLSISISNKTGFNEIKITQSKTDWTIIFDAGIAKKIEVNGKVVVPIEKMIKLTGSENVIRVY